MGTWSRLAGDAFLRWLAPPPAGAGSTSAAATARSPSCSSSAARRRGARHRSVRGADRVRARARSPTGAVRFASATRWRCPYADDAFDAAVMALVIFFVPDPAKAVAEMARVVAPGGSVVGVLVGHARRRLPVRRAAGGDGPRSPRRRSGRRASRRRASRRLRSLWADAGLDGDRDARDRRRAQLRRLRVVLGDRADRAAPRSEHRGDGDRRPADAERSAARPARPPTRRAGSRSARARTRSRDGCRASR